MKISLVLPIYNRGPERLDRLLTTVEWQTEPFLEVFVVDASDDLETQGRNDKVCGHRAVHLSLSLPEVNFPRMYNVGIKHTNLYTDWVACTNCDMLFAPSFVTVLSKLLRDRVEFARSQAAILPESADYTDFGTEENWRSLLGVAIRRFPLGYGIICAPRDWWFRVRGYDESLSGGLGVYDGDVRKRAEAYGLNTGHTLYEDAPVLHQWHPKSPLKHHNQPKRDDDPPIVKNPGSWGEL
jgi:glycosyltransferase involved in cell wall biosynthesis